MNQPIHKSIPPRAVAYIDKSALIHNYTVLSEGVKEVSPDCVSVCVVKADAYGHGTSIVVPSLWASGCRHFAVATLDEACKVSRLTPSAPSLLLVLGHTPPEGVGIAAQEDITLTCVSFDHAVALSEAAVSAGVTVKCHIAVDTGMNRIGLPAHTKDEINTAALEAEKIMRLPGLSVTGMFTHFALADEDYSAAVSPDSHTLSQYARYKAVYDRLNAQGLRPPFCHICNSAAAIRLPHLYPDVCFDGVRFGISLYGYGVSPAPHHGYTLRPVMKLCTRVVHLHHLHPGEIVSYGGRYKADAPRDVATLSIGYADGFRRGFEGGIVTVHTAQGDYTASLIGRICMDQCMLDVTGLPVAVGDQITLFGATCPAFEAPQSSLEALCDRAETIPYEALCLVTDRVARVAIPAP